MYLTKLTLTNFRNYAHLELNLAPGLTIAHGDNAQGKTNLLEAIFYLATARSPHAGAERELIRWGALSEPIPFARAQAEAVRREDETLSLEIVVVLARPSLGSLREGDENQAPSNRASKRIKVNGVNKRAIDLLGNLQVVLFLPEDLDLVFGAPSERRRYLDTTLSQIDARYTRALSQYNQVLEQRNALLRDFRERSFNPTELETWDAKLLEAGSYIMARRARAVADYNELVAELHPRLTAKREALRILYQPNVPLGNRAPSPQLALALDSAPTADADIASRFERQLRELRSRELAAGMTLVGPHRDDLRFFIDSVDMITYASRGQGRTIALSLKMAELELMRAETGEMPILLLDDVMSELDKTRRSALAHLIEHSSQAIVTAIDLDDFPSELLQRARVVRVSEGQVQPPDAEIEAAAQPDAQVDETFNSNESTGEDTLVVEAASHASAAELPST
jgi:DNA replication and repair protein RecF